jgi:hypothetical protein
VQDGPLNGGNVMAKALAEADGNICTDPLFSRSLDAAQRKRNARRACGGVGFTVCAHRR